MDQIFAGLLSLVGLICIIFNRFAVEETQRMIPERFFLLRLPVWVFRLVVILSGTCFVLFGIFRLMGYMA